MKKWPLNSITLFAVTHSKLRKVSDGTDTQVATCIINKWTAKINKRRIYNGKCPPGEKGDRKRRRKIRKTVAVLRTLESSRHEALKNREEKEFILGQSPRINFYPFSTHSTIQFPYGLVQLPKLSLRPRSWAHFSTKFIVLGLLGLGSFISTVKDLPKVDLTIGAVCGKNLCANENNNWRWWDQTPTGQAPISLSQPNPSSRVISQTLSMVGTKRTEGFRKGAWTLHKPAEVIPVWAVIYPIDGMMNKPCSER